MSGLHLWKGLWVNKTLWVSWAVHSQRLQDSNCCLSASFLNEWVSQWTVFYSFGSALTLDAILANRLGSGHALWAEMIGYFIYGVYCSSTVVINQWPCRRLTKASPHTRYLLPAWSPTLTSDLELTDVSVLWWIKSLWHYCMLAWTKCFSHSAVSAEKDHLGVTGIIKT